jgi:tetratricopeptide (TPR) repeat protein
VTGTALGTFLAAALAAGCASRTAGSQPFVRKGGPGFVDVGGPPQAVASALDAEALERVKREALAKRAAEKAAPLPSIEGRDQRLREALADLAKSPTAAAHIRVAEEYRRVGIHDVAVDHYSDALRLEPRSAAALDGRARLWRDSHVLGLALADAHRARFYAPKSAAVRNTLATILERRGLCREALAEYREALRLKPDAAWAQENVTRLAAICS